jgi:hypothetical protein
MKIWLQRKGSALVPYHSEDHDLVAKLPSEPFMVTYTRVRSPRHHRKYMKFISVVFDNLPESIEYYVDEKTGLMTKRWPDVNSFRKMMECYSGHYTETISLKGERHIQPKSIRYEELDETEFIELHDKVKAFISTRIIPEMDVDVYERELSEFI